MRLTDFNDRSERRGCRRNFHTSRTTGVTKLKNCRHSNTKERYFDFIDDRRSERFFFAGGRTIGSTDVDKYILAGFH